MDEEGNLLYSNNQSKLQYTHLPVIQKNILTETNDFVKHNISVDNKNVKIYSAFIPFHVFGHRMGVFFSMQQGFIFSLLFTRILLVSLLNAAVLIFLLLLIYRSGGKDFVKHGQKAGKLAHLQSIFDKLPVGILVLDPEQNTLLVNQTAREMLLIKGDEPIAGKNLTDRFMLSRDYYDPGSETAFDSNQFVLYRHEGEEVAVYKKDLPFNLDDKEYIVSVFSDITPIEKATKIRGCRQYRQI